MKKTIYLFLSIMLLSLYGCIRSDDNIVEVTNPTPVSTKKGSVSGKVMAKNGTKPIGGALVFTFDGQNKIYRTFSNAAGDFTLEAPEGQRTIHIQTGDGSNFRSEFTINVPKSDNVVAPLNVTKLNQVANMAYVKGSYDEIEDIVTGLGYLVTEIDYNDLKVMSTLSQYDVIFLNCGSRGQSHSGTSTPNNDTEIYDNLATFVSNGGSLYASDWDVAYLLGGNNNTPACNTAGGFIPDALMCSTSTGSATTYTNCAVSNVNLANALGFNTLDIQYDLGSWQKVINYDAAFWEVLVQRNNEALMLRTNKFHSTGAPAMPVGNSANSGWITICHDDNGTPVTLTINQNALQAHLGHGDSVGSCTGVSTSGNIYYTTFHNHATGNIGNTAPILQYVILNL